MNSTDTSLQRSLSFMVLASLMFALTGAFARLLKDEYASVHLVLFRNVIGVVFVLYWRKHPTNHTPKLTVIFCMHLE